MRLRPAAAVDAEAMAQAHAEAFDASWGAHEIASLLAGPGGLGFVVDEDDGLAGFILCRVIADEAEVLTLATRPPSRRRGVAAALIEVAAGAARAAGAASLFLEVAADNAAALALYQGAAFAPVGQRGGYYGRPDAAAVDALVLRRAL